MSKASDEVFGFGLGIVLIMFIILFSGTVFSDNSTRTYYLKPCYGGYNVIADTTFKDSTVSECLPLPEATMMVNDLNKTLWEHKHKVSY
jgi:hypothetical protein